MVAFTRWGRPSAYQSSTWIRLCTGDHDDKAPTSASASRITAGGASMTISRDARTATKDQAINAVLPAKRLCWQMPDYQSIWSSGVVAGGGGPTGPAGVRENRGAGAAWSTPLALITVARAVRCGSPAASLHDNTGVTHASVPAKISAHSSRVLLANRVVKTSNIRVYEPISS